MEAARRYLAEFVGTFALVFIGTFVVAVGGERLGGGAATVVIAAFGHGLILMAMVWCTAWQVGKVSDQRCLWFLAGAASHSLTDLFTHSRDGLLVLWPLNRTFRFDAGIDQWDLAGAGQVLLVMELGLVFGVACYELCRRCRPFLEFYRLPSVRQSGLTILGQTQNGQIRLHAAFRIKEVGVDTFAHRRITGDLA